MKAQAGEDAAAKVRGVAMIAEAGLDPVLASLEAQVVPVADFNRAPVEAPARAAAPVQEGLSATPVQAAGFPGRAVMPIVGIRAVKEAEAAGRRVPSSRGWMSAFPFCRIANAWPWWCRISRRVGVPFR